MRRIILSVTCGMIWLAVSLGLAGCEKDLGLPGLSAGWQETSQQYGILIYGFVGPGHKQQAERQLEAVESLTGWRGLHVLSQDDGSQVMWGKYPTVQAAQADLARAKAFVTSAGAKPFARAIIKPLPSQDVGPPEWNLADAPGEYTVMVAVFFDVPEAGYVGRKKFAVQYCRQLREEKGEQAFYYHGRARSAVTIGVFDQSVVQIHMKGSTPKAVVADPRVAAIIDRYPLLAVNGREERIRGLNPRTRKYESVSQKSRLVPVPGKKVPHELRENYRTGYPQPW